MSDLSILIVSWNVRDLLLRCLAAIPAAVGDDLRYEIIVVDNNSQDGTVAAIGEAYPQVRVIANKENRGFTAGNNQALAIAQGDALFLLNPDTEPFPQSIATLYRYLQDHVHVGMVGPRLWYGDGKGQPSRRRFPTLGTLFAESTIVQHYCPHLSLFGRYIVADKPASQKQQVDWIVGAAMMIRREVYLQVGGMDEGFFMYAEELDWCRRIVAAGWTIVYVPAAEVTHYEGKSSEQVVPARHIHFFRSRIRYTRKYHGRLWAGILRLWLLLTFTFQWCREGLKWLLGHKRTLRAERMQAYQMVLRSGLR